MQAPGMRAFRFLNPGKNLHSITFLNYSYRISCKSHNHPRLPRKTHSTPHRRSPDEAAAARWSALPDSPLPADTASTRKSTLQTVYDPTSGRVITTRDVSVGKVADSVGEPISTSSTIDQGSRIYGDVIGSSGVRGSIKKKGKSRSVYVCEDCGYSDGQWWGTCRQCEKVGTMKRFTTEDVERKLSGTEVSEKVVRAWLPTEVVAPSPVKLTDVYDRINVLDWRIPLPGPFGAEVGRVLGGGLVPGSLVLVGGDPGVGKSTLLLQIADLIALRNGIDDPARVIYVSGEESVEQIGTRADRLNIGNEDIYLHSSTDIEDILEQAQRLSPKAIVIDSIQTVYLNGVTGNAGGDSQVKECTSALLRFAKRTNIPILLIGHVTKTGDIAGPRVLEHIVDVVLYMEGEKLSSHRLLRSVKNRFGSTDELGIFKMSQAGLQGVSNPSEMYLSEQHSVSDYLAGLAVTVIMDGSRAFLIEVQALCVAGSSFMRHVNGIQASKADMIISVIIKQVGLKLQENGIFLNVVSGMNLTETAGDLAIAAAICSSFLEFPIPNGIAFIAEVGLAGELRLVPQLEKRVITLAKLGYKKCVIPKLAEKSFSGTELHGMEILGCDNLKEMINAVFRSRPP
ncbi:hypothetical protein F511_18657 [Dorcoceras hygrometricum]|uniref:RecA family profile 1 domain-containing protein n=1 Tax=Dorcoceras hygrometricum TaxID=472368 RepID=A0A2Z7DGN1_9LAMI|nr:hypothetical protein F511_18657 [Dorcoceras hygrometricum]